MSQLALEELEEWVLLGSDLRQDQMIETGVNILPDRVQVRFWRRTQADLLGDMVRGDVAARGRESAGIRQLRHYRAAGQRPAMVVVRDLARLILARRVAHRHLSVERPLAAGRAKSFNEIGLRCGR